MILIIIIAQLRESEAKLHDQEVKFKRETEKEKKEYQAEKRQMELKAQQELQDLTRFLENKQTFAIKFVILLLLIIRTIINGIVIGN